jgi:hypothetical protein
MIPDLSRTDRQHLAIARERAPISPEVVMACRNSNQRNYAHKQSITRIVKAHRLEATQSSSRQSLVRFKCCRRATRKIDMHVLHIKQCRWRVSAVDRDFDFATFDVDINKALFTAGKTLELHMASIARKARIA